MKKFIQSTILENLEVLTDEGWFEIDSIHKTIPYNIFEVKTENYTLKCADDHVLFNNNMDEIFVKNLSVGDVIITKTGEEKITSIVKTDIIENMYDLELSVESKKRYYTDGILSHNTTYLKYLANILDKEILFIPPSMAESLSEPAIIPFLMENRDTILIIEDAEKVISNRQINGSSAGVSNILNLTDGILGDCLNIQIIATFNMSKNNIDNALLRKGRLIAEHKFEALPVDDTNKLLKHLNKDVISNKPMVLSDIYNIDVEEFKTKEKQKLGFNQ